MEGTPLLPDNTLSQAVLDRLPVAVFVCDPAGRIRYWNRHVEEEWGHVPEAIQRMAPEEFFVASHRPLIQHAIQVAFQEEPAEVAARIVTADGRRIPSQFIVHRIEGEEEPLAAAFALDITVRKQTEDELQLADAVLDGTSEGVMITDREERIVAVNRAFTEITGYTEEEVLSHSPRILHSGRHGKEHYLEMWRSICETGRWQGEVWNRRKDGSVYPEMLTISIVTDDNGEIANYVGVFSDISHIKKSQEEMEHLAHHDPLTGLANRLLLRARLESAVSRASEQGRLTGLLLIGLDRFRLVNSGLGHQHGDTLLQQIAQRLKQAVRHGDTVARMGGDQFAVLLESLVHAGEADRLAQEIKQALNEPFTVADCEIQVNASIGISVHPSDGESVDALLKNADAAMHRAKRTDGDNIHCFYTSEMTTQALERIVIERELQKAIETGQLVLHYHPQVSLKDARLVGVEALVRWHHPREGLLPPDRFIPIAEECGLITPLTQWVLHTACRQAREWLDAGVDFGRMAVNVAPVQFRQAGFVETVERALRESDLPPRILELEVTETGVMTGGDEIDRTINRLRELGVPLSIDDFGTGYSSLSHLRSLPVDKLKIDKSFIQDLPNDDNAIAIVQAVIALGRALNLPVLAEGIETEEQREFLLQAGADEAQGFLWGKPCVRPALILPAPTESDS